MLPDYKYSLHLALITISHFFTSLIRVFSLLLVLAMMEDKRGTKRSHSPSKEGSSSLNGGSTPPPVLSRSPPPPGSLSEISSRRPCLLVFEQGDPSKKVPVVDMSSSSDEEGLIPATSWDEEFTRRLFGDLNRDVLGLPSDGKVIILSDSDEKEEVHEEDVVDAEATPSSAVKSLGPTASTTDVVEDPKGLQDDNSDGLAPDQERGDGSCGRDKVDSP
jgi:hypothetical protein